MAWWHWIVVGLILIALEMAASGGFYVIFFGIAAIVIGALHTLDLAGPPWLQFLLFSAISVGSMLFFRRPLLRWMNLDGPSVDVDSLVGQTAIPLEDIAPGEVGRAELRGSVWTARNRAALAVHKGQRCTVTAVDRLMIFVEPEGARQ